MIDSTSAALQSCKIIANPGLVPSRCQIGSLPPHLYGLEDILRGPQFNVDKALELLAAVLDHLDVLDGHELHAWREDGLRNVLDRHERHMGSGWAPR